MEDKNRINLEMNIVFKDKFKEGTKYPWLKGYVSVEGKVYECAMWPVKSGKPNSFSGTLKLKEKSDQKPEKFTGQTSADLESDDMPFAFLLPLALAFLSMGGIA